MAIDQIDRAVVITDFPTPAVRSVRRVERRQSLALGLGVAIARTAAMLALASLAILVLLPAAIAAQAAVAI